MKQLAYVLTLGLLLACQEDNPYKDQQRVQTSSGPSNGAADAGGQIEPNSDITETEPVAADPDALGDALAFVQEICQNTQLISQFTTELNVLCINGQATTTLAEGIAAPYMGGDDPQPNILRSENVSGISHFVFFSAMELPLPLETIMARRAEMNPLDFTEGNTTANQMEIAARAAEGGGDLGGYDLRLDVAVRVIPVILTIRNTNIMQRDFSALNDDQSLVLMTTILKPGAEENPPNGVANSVNFWIADGARTKLVTVSHQQVANQGQHGAATNTMTSFGRRFMIDTYNLYSQ